MRVDRVPWMITAMLLMLAALWAGLLRLGWAWPSLWATLPMSHGPLMVGGFLGVLIGMERAVGLGSRPAYLTPLAAGVGAILTTTATGGLAGPLLITLASIGMVITNLAIWRIQPVHFTVVLVLASAAWTFGNVAWLLGASVPQVTLAWAAFLVLTIAGERLELSRMLRPPRWASWLFNGTMLLILVGMAAALFDFRLGVRVTALGWLLLGAWLLRFDIASRRIRAGGQARYMATALLLGYGWLLIGGVIGLLWPVVQAGPVYDAFLHAVFVGFVFSMIFAHALIILPAVLGVDVIYRPRFYVHLWLLHGGLVLRVVGDLWPWWEARQWGGLLNALVIVLFLANTVSATRLRRGVRDVVGDDEKVTHAVSNATVR